MKNKKLLKLACALSLLTVCVAAISSHPSKIAPFEREQTHGNIRVVLLKVERMTLFTSEGIRDAVPGKIYPVPTFGVTFVAEALGKEPIKNWYSDDADEDLTIEGKRISSDEIFPENLIAGSRSDNSSFAPSFGNGPEMRPKLADEKRAVVMERFIRYGQIPSGKLRLKLKVGINDHPENFVFDGISVN